jgi:hypothetical protein
MTPVALVIVGTLVLAILLAALLPGVGFIAAIAILVIGIAAALWLLAAARSGQAPSEIAVDTEEHEFLGPGGPDDPRR